MRSAASGNGTKHRDGKDEVESLHVVSPANDSSLTGVNRARGKLEPRRSSKAAVRVRFKVELGDFTRRAVGDP